MHRDVSRKIRSATILLQASMALAALTACGGGSTGDSSQLRGVVVAPIITY